MKRPKPSASRKRGRKRVRPSKAVQRAERLLERMRAMHAKIADKCRDIDPHDLWLIIERLCREPGHRGPFFIYPKPGGGYVF